MYTFWYVAKIDFIKSFLSNFVSKVPFKVQKSEKNWTLQKPFAIMGFVNATVSKRIHFDTVAFYKIFFAQKKDCVSHFY